MFTSNNLNKHTTLFAMLLSIIAGICICSDVYAQSSKPKELVGKRAEPVLIDSIVAVVNTEVITRSDLQKGMDLVEKNIRSRNAAMPPRNEFQKQVLERMIVDRAQLHIAKEAGIRVDDVFLDRAISLIAEQSKISLS